MELTTLPCSPQIHLDHQYLFFFFVSLLSFIEIVFPCVSPLYFKVNITKICSVYVLPQRTYKMTRFIVSNQEAFHHCMYCSTWETFQSPKEAWCPREEVHYQMTRLRPLTRSHLSHIRFGNCTHCSFWWESVDSAEDDQYCQEERRLRGGKV